MKTSSQRPPTKPEACRVGGGSKPPGFAAIMLGLPTDFYHQTLHRPDNYVREGLEVSLATIEKLDKPVVAYTALGAGRLLPKDGLCVGVFPKKRNELAENAGLTRQLSENRAA